MQPLKAVVQNGRPVADEPTALPEGTEVALLSVEETRASGAADDFDDEERAALHDSLHEGTRQMKTGETIDAAEALAELRAHQ